MIIKNESLPDNILNIEDIRNKIINGDILSVLKKLPDNSVDCVITSSPYYSLRSYPVPDTIWGGDENCKHDWEIINQVKINLQAGNDEFKREWREKASDNETHNSNVCNKCGAYKGQLGLEPTADLFVEHIILVMKELFRILKEDGTLWYNISDTFTGRGGASRHFGYSDPKYKEGRNGSFVEPSAFKQKSRPKSLMMIPEKIAIKMVEELGFILRNKIIWHKKNSMPESCADRFGRSYEFVYFFTKNEDYFFEQQFEEYQTKLNRWGGDKLIPKENKVSGWDSGTGQSTYRERDLRPNDLGRNMRDVWSINTKPFIAKNIGVDDIDHYACVDEETEILTYTGWKTYKNVKLNEKIISYNLKTEQLENDEIMELFVYEYNGKMISVSTKNINMCLSPNHRTIVKKRRGNIKEIIIEADKLFRDYTIPVARNFTDNNICGNIFEYPKLAGFFLADGSFHKNCGYSYIEQWKEIGKIYLKELSNKHNFKIFERKLIYKGIEKKGLSLRISKEITEELKNLFEHRRKPSWKILQYPLWWLQEFLDGFIIGDGSIRKDGRISMVKTQEIIDLMQAICVKLGYCTKVSSKKNTLCWMLYLTKKKNASLRGTKGEGNVVQQIDYNNKIWCVASINTTFIARRKGIVFITGNSFPSQLVERCLKSVKNKVYNFIVLDPFMGSGTTGLVASKNNVDFIGIELSKSYCNLAEKRINIELEKNKLF